MRIKSGSWKQKIDPAFDKTVEYVLQTLSQSDLAANTGWIIIRDYYLKIIEQKGMQGWIKHYKNVLDMEEEIKKVIKNLALKERNKYLGDFEKGLFENIKMLPEESGEYYKERLKPSLSKKHRFEYFGKVN